MCITVNRDDVARADMIGDDSESSVDEDSEMDICGPLAWVHGLPLNHAWRCHDDGRRHR